MSVANGAETTVKLNKYTFGITAENKKAWEKATGKTVTSAKFIVADNAENKVSVRVNPVDVDATAIEFVAINGKNEVLPNVTFVANEDKNYATEVRAAYGNGLYHMTVKQFTLADDKASDALDKAMAKDKGYYALTANKVYRAEYNMKFQIEAATAAIGDILVDDPRYSPALLRAGVADERHLGEGRRIYPSGCSRWLARRQGESIRGIRSKRGTK